MKSTNIPCELVADSSTAVQSRIHAPSRVAARVGSDSVAWLRSGRLLASDGWCGWP
jgi:hypothetical protein